MSFTAGMRVLGSGSRVTFEAAEPLVLPEIFRLKNSDRWLGREGRTLKGAGTSCGVGVTSLAYRREN